MKVKELIVTNDKVVANYEIYYSPFGKESFHTDNIRRYDEQDAMEKQVIKYALMDESEYDSTICANTDPADFSEWYDNKDAKVLVILVNIEVETMCEKIYKVMFPHDNTICEYDDPDALKQDLLDMGLPLSLMDFPTDDILLESSKVYENECGSCKVWVEIHDYK